ncbi:hypothetical protein JD844_013463 [Phrynosoma platyrhinos]|uniref:Flotillin n=1 Tax=Phrynosoma platyrhinos TaxID=52577 RepID=A0ABQ7TLP9_PHRPL|nr:hypothetical protein JD844_013463 [Phrynosoma platyrhinos]
MIRKERELEAKVKKPAEAERYRLEKLAEAERTQLIMQAEAEAEAVRVKGEAEAYAIEAKARADAEQMAKKAEAFKQYQEVAMVDMLLEKLPEMAEEITKPMTSVNKITMVSSGTGDVGAAKITGEVLEIMNKMPDTVEKLTGISISQSDLRLAKLHCDAHASSTHMSQTDLQPLLATPVKRAWSDCTKDLDSIPVKSLL